MLGVDVADVADLGSEGAATGDAGEVGAAVPGRFSVTLLHRAVLLHWGAVGPLRGDGGPGVGCRVASPALPDSHNRIGELVHIILQRHGVLGFQVVLDYVALALHGALTDRAVKYSSLHLAGSVLGLHSQALISVLPTSAYESGCGLGGH